MYVLGIETSCDETAFAIVKDGSIILSNIVASQADLHARYGGVVPELACRRHIDLITVTLQQALQESQMTLEQIDLIAFTQGPGLIGALLVGVNMGKGIALATNKPFVGVNHVEAHLYAAIMNQELSFPALGIVISGGHTFFLKIESFGKYQLISQTVDDALGEAFDKVACMLGLTYPGGPQIENLAKKGDARAFTFSAGQVKKNPLDFSFSGLKTAVLYALRGQDGKLEPILDEQTKADVAASFQHIAFSDLIKKANLAVEMHRCKSIVLGGGVTANMLLRKMFQERCSLPLYWPNQALSSDNGAMIAALGYNKFKLYGGDDFTIQPFAKLGW